MKEIKDLKLKAKKDLVALNSSELKKELVNAKKLMFELKMKLEVSELKQTHLIKPLRRYVAVINTIANTKTI
ncbi:MAG: 50S ribosomal protein L29 [Candidatus Gracilibacteria bacterium]|nr:50S ribosomal protein L29 [Candidatus Gracilibacteria bacterium]